MCKLEKQGWKPFFPNSFKKTFSKTQFLFIVEGEVYQAKGKSLQHNLKADVLLHNDVRLPTSMEHKGPPFLGQLSALLAFSSKSVFHQNQEERRC